MRSARTRLSLAQVLAYGPFTGREGEGSESGGAGSGAGGTGGAGSQNTGGNDDKTGGAGQSGSDADDDTDDPAELKKKLANRVAQNRRQDEELRRLRESQRELDELKAEKEKRDREGASELENAQRDLEKANTRIPKLLDTVRELTLENTFLKLDGIDWHDADAALRLVDLSGVEFDNETGAVKDASKLVDAAKKLAKDKPYLVKGKTAVGSNVPEGRPSGAPPASGSGTNVATEDAKVRDKYRIRR